MNISEDKEETGTPKETPKQQSSEKSKQPKRNPKSEKMVTMQKSEFVNLINRVDELEKKKIETSGGISIEDVAQLIRASRDEDNALGSAGIIREEDIDPEDYLDTEHAISFFAPTAGFLIVDDIRSGRVIATPYKNPIWFDYAGEERVGDGKSMTLNVYSQYLCRSKKESDWLKAHRHFGIIFFEDMKKALNMDFRIMKSLYKCMTTVNAMTPQSIQYELRNAGLKPSTNYEANKRDLSFHYAEKEREKIMSDKDRKEQPMYNRGDGGKRYGRSLNEFEEAGIGSVKKE